MIASQADTFKSLAVQRIGERTGIAIAGHARDGCPIGNILGNTVLDDGRILGNFDGLRSLTNGKLPAFIRQVGYGIVVRPLLHADLDNVFARVDGRHFGFALIVFDRDSAHAVDAGIRFDRGGLGVSVIGQGRGHGKGEVACRRRGLCNGILHAGGHAAQGDAGGVGTRVGGGSLKGGAVLCVGDGVLIHRQTLPAGFCQRRFFALTVAVGYVRRLVDGHAAAAGGALAALGSDGRAACRVRPAMLMPGHGERLAVALVAVVAPHMNAVLVAAVFRQIADGERPAFRPGMRRIIHCVEILTTEPIFV